MKLLTLIALFSIISNYSLANSNCSIQQFEFELDQIILNQDTFNQRQSYKIFEKYVRCPASIKVQMNDLFYKITSKVYSNDIVIELLSKIKTYQGKGLLNYFEMLNNPLTKSQMQNLLSTIANLRIYIDASQDKEMIVRKLTTLLIDYNEIDLISSLGPCPTLLSGHIFQQIEEFSYLQQGLSDQVFEKLELDEILGTFSPEDSLTNFILIYLTPQDYKNKLKEIAKLEREREEQERLMSEDSESGETQAREESAVEVSLNVDRELITLPPPRSTSVPFPKVLTYDFLLSRNIEFVGTITNDQKYASGDLQASKHKGSKYYIFRSGLKFGLPIKDDSGYELSLIGTPYLRVDGFHSGLNLENLSSNRSMATFELGTELQVDSKEFGKIKLQLIGGPEVRISGGQKGQVLPYGFLLFSITK